MPFDSPLFLQSSLPANRAGGADVSHSLDNLRPKGHKRQLCQLKLLQPKGNPDHRDAEDQPQRQVLQTLRSRCVELKLQPAAETAGETGEAAEALCRALGKRRRGAVTELAVRLERKKLSREELADLLERTRACCAEALLLHYGRPPRQEQGELGTFLAKNLTKTQIMRTIELLQKYHGECAFNVGVGHVLGALAAELEGIL